MKISDKKRGRGGAAHMTLTHPGPFTDVKKLFGKNGALVQINLKTLAYLYSCPEAAETY